MRDINELGWHGNGMDGRVSMDGIQVVVRMQGRRWVSVESVWMVKVVLKEAELWHGLQR